MAAALLVGGNDPGLPKVPQSGVSLPAHPVCGPVFHIPCHTERLPSEVVGIELWYSTDGGKTWSKSGDIPRDRTQFEFQAQKAGEHVFAVRVRFKDGSVQPKNNEDLVPEMRAVVAFDSANERREKVVRAVDEAEELDQELTRLELELIRKEMKRLALEPVYSPETAEKIDRLRARLGQIRARLREGGAEQLRAPAGPIPGPSQREPENVIPSVVVPAPLPVVPMAPPVVPEAPPPHAPERPS
jgi:hypothetical protein